MSRVLKPADDGTRVGSIQTFDLRPVQERAAAIIAESKAVLARAGDQAEAIKEAARAEGFELGRQEGREAGRQEGVKEGLRRSEDLVRTLTAALDAFDTRRAALVTDAETHLARLAVAVADRVLKAHVSADPAAVTGNVKAALDLTAGADAVTIAAAPDDVEHIRAFLPRLGARIAGDDGAAADGAPIVTLTSDASIRPGGCVVQTAGGEIDARIESQLDEIERQLIGRETE